MYHHLILIEKSYTKEERVGFHLVQKNRINKIEFQSIMDKVIEIPRNDMEIQHFIAYKKPVFNITGFFISET